MKSPYSKMINYSALAAGFIALGNRADGQVIFNDIDPDFHIYSWPFYDFAEEGAIDVNADGIDDFSLGIFYNDICGYCDPTSIAIVDPLGSNQMSYVAVTAYSDCSFESILLKITKEHNDGEMIDESALFTTENVLVFNNDGGYDSCEFSFVGNNDFEQQFIGFRLKLDDGFHYGWMRLTVKDHHLIVHDCAYETLPETPLITAHLAPTSVSWGELHDTGDAINGTDLQFAFFKASDEENITEYRVICLPAEMADTFTIDDALALSPDLYKVIIPSGLAEYETTLDADAKDVTGDLITNNIAYKLFVLSYKDGGASLLSGASEDITLKTGMDNLDVVLTDVADAGNASDMELSFEASESEAAIAEYRIIFLEGDAYGFSIEDAEAVAPENYTVILPTGESVVFHPSPTQTDIDGNMIEYAVEYTAVVMSVNNGLANNSGLSASDPLILNGPTGVAKELILTDVADHGNASDIQITFELAPQILSVEEYRIILVPEADAIDFSIEEALDLLPFHYYEFPADTSGTYSLIFPYYTTDIHEENIEEGMGYYAYVVSMAGEYGTVDTMSMPSNMLVPGYNTIQEIDNGFAEISVMNGMLMISLAEPASAEINCRITTTTGQLVFESAFRSQQMSFGLNLPHGMYIISLVSSDQLFVKKILLASGY